MEMEANNPEDVHIGYGHDLPALRKKTIFDNPFEKEKQFTGIYYSVDYVVGRFVQCPAAHHFNMYSAKFFCRN